MILLATIKAAYDEDQVIGRSRDFDSVSRR
jgi:hypothetical protein